MYNIRQIFDNTKTEELEMLVYLMNILSESAEGYSERLFLESSHPFVSPIGTKYFISLEDCAVYEILGKNCTIDLKVTYCEDNYLIRIDKKISQCFAMILTDADDSDDDDNTVYFDTPTVARAVVEGLKSLGWRSG